MFLKWKKRYWPESNRCDPEDVAEPMRLEALHGVFLLLFAIIEVAFVVLLLEVIFYNIFTKKTWWSKEAIYKIKRHCMRKPGSLRGRCKVLCDISP